MSCAIDFTSLDNYIYLGNRLNTSDFLMQLREYYQGLSKVAPDISLLTKEFNEEILPDYLDNYTLEQGIGILEDPINATAINGLWASLHNNVLVDPVYKDTRTALNIVFNDYGFNVVGAFLENLKNQLEAQKAQAPATEPHEISGLKMMEDYSSFLFETRYGDLGAYRKEKYKGSSATELILRNKFIKNAIIKSMFINTDTKNLVNQEQKPRSVSEIDKNLKDYRKSLLNGLLDRLDVLDDNNVRITDVDVFLKSNHINDLLKAIERRVMIVQYGGKPTSLRENNVLVEISGKYKRASNEADKEEYGSIIENYVDYLIASDFDMLFSQYGDNVVTANTAVEPFSTSVRKYSFKGKGEGDAGNANWNEKIQNGVDLSSDLYKAIIETTPIISYITGKEIGDNLYPALVASVFANYFDELDPERDVKVIREIIIRELNNPKNSYTNKNVLYTLHKNFFELDGDNIAKKDPRIFSFLDTLESYEDKSMLLLITKPILETAKMYYAEAAEVNRSLRIVETNKKTSLANLTIIKNNIFVGLNKDLESLKRIVDKYSITFGPNVIKYKDPNNGGTYELKDKKNTNYGLIVELSKDLFGIDFKETGKYKEFAEELRAAAVDGLDYPESYIRFIYDALQEVIKPRIELLSVTDAEKEAIRKDRRNHTFASQALNALKNGNTFNPEELEKNILPLNTKDANTTYEQLEASENRYTGNRLKSTVMTLEGTTVAGYGIYNYGLGLKQNLNRARRILQNSVIRGDSENSPLFGNMFVKDPNLLRTMFVRNAIKVGAKVKGNSAQSNSETLYFNINLGYFGRLADSIDEKTETELIFDVAAYSDKTTNYLPSIRNSYLGQELFVKSNGKAVPESITKNLHFESNQHYYRAFTNNVIGTWRKIYEKVSPKALAAFNKKLEGIKNPSAQLTALNDLNNKFWNAADAGFAHGLSNYSAARFYANEAGVELINWVHFQNNGDTLADVVDLSVKPNLIEYIANFENRDLYEEYMAKALLDFANNLREVGFKLNDKAVGVIKSMYNEERIAPFVTEGGLFVTSGGKKATGIGQINPAIRKYFYDHNMVSENFMNSFLGPIYGHKGNNSNKQLITQTKRNVAATASIRKYSLGLEMGVEDYTTTAFVDDFSTKLLTVLGEEHTVIDLDGASYETIFQRIKTWNSLNYKFSGDGGIDHKSFISHFDPKTGHFGMTKHAAFSMSYDMIRKSIGSDVDLMELHKDLLRGDLSKTDITKSWKGGIDLSNFDDVYYWKRSYNYDLDIAGEIWKLEYIKNVGTDADGNMLYDIGVQNMTMAPNVIDPIRNVPIKTFYDLWQILGGIDSVDITETPTEIAYEDHNEKRTVYFKPSISSAYHLVRYESYAGPDDMIYPEEYMTDQNDTQAAAYSVYTDMFATHGVLQRVISLYEGYKSTRPDKINDPILLAEIAKEFNTLNAKVTPQEFLARITKPEVQEVLDNLFGSLEHQGTTLPGRDIKRYQRFKGANIDRISTAGAQKAGRINMNDSGTINKSKRKKFVTKVISGGQTGADRLGLEVAKSLGIPTGGVAPKGFKTEKGNDPSLKDFGLTEHTSSDYNPRTIENLTNSDATVLFGDVTSKGSMLTVNNLLKLNKPYTVNPTAEELSNFLRLHNVKTLNVAGNRGSKLTKEQITEYTNVLTTALKSTTLDEVPGVSKLIPTRISNINAGVQLNAAHETEKSKVTAPSQMINAFVFNAKTLPYVSHIYEALANVVDRELSYYLSTAEGSSMVNIPNAVNGLSLYDHFKQNKDILLRIFKDLMDSKVRQGEEFTLESLIVATFDHNTLPFDDSHIFNNAVSELANYFTTSGIRINFDGMFAVLTPGSGSMQMYDVKGGYLPVKNKGKLEYKALDENKSTSLTADSYLQWVNFNAHIQAHPEKAGAFPGVAKALDISQGKGRDLKGQQIKATFKDGSTADLTVLRSGQSNLIPEAQALEVVKGIIDDYKEQVKKVKDDDKVEAYEKLEKKFEKDLKAAIDASPQVKYAYEKFLAKQEAAGIKFRGGNFTEFIYDTYSKNNKYQNKKVEDSSGEKKDLSRKYMFLDKVNGVGKVFLSSLHEFFDELTEYREGRKPQMPASLMDEILIGKELATKFKSGAALDIEVTRGECIAPVTAMKSFLLKEGDDLSEIDAKFFERRLNERLDIYDVKAHSVLLSKFGKKLYVQTGQRPTEVEVYKNLITIKGDRWLVDDSNRRLLKLDPGVDIGVVGNNLMLYLNAGSSQDLEINEKLQSVAKALNRAYKNDGDSFNVIPLANPEVQKAKAKQANIIRAIEMANSWEVYKDVIGTRIPGQHYQSFQGLRIVGFTEGNKIYVPNEVTLLSGSDFDIDKQNVIYHSVSGEGLISSWHGAFDFSTVANLRESMKLPLPIGRDSDYFLRPNAQFREVFKVIDTDTPDVHTIRAIYDAIDQGQRLDEKAVKILAKLLEWESLSKEVTTNGVKNFTISMMNRTIESPSNFIYLYKPVAMDTPKTFADDSPKGAAAAKAVRENPYSITSQKEANMIGKKVIGIMATALKVFSALSYTYNSELRVLAEYVKEYNQDLAMGTDPQDPGMVELNKKIKRITDALKINLDKNQNTTFKGYHGFFFDMISNVNLDAIGPEALEHYYKALGERSDDINDILATGDASQLKSYLRVHAGFQEDAAEILSQLLSAATDNAKELILGKINASPELAGVYSTLLMLGTPFEQISDFLTSPEMEYLLKVGISNIFEKNTAKNSLSDFCTTIKKLSEPGLKDKARAKLLKKLNERYSTRFLEGAVVDTKTQTAYDAEKFVHMSYYFEMADEVTLLGRYLSINQGVKSNNWDLYKFTTGIENYVNQVLPDYKFSFKKFLDSLATGGDYHTKAIDQLSQVKKLFNVLFVLSTNPHFAKQLTAYNSATAILKLSSYKVAGVYNVTEKLRDYGFLRKTQALDKNQFAEVERFIDNTIVETFISNKYMNYITKDANNIAAVKYRPLFYDKNGVQIQIHTVEGQAFFADWVVTEFYDKIKSMASLENNEFISHLTTDFKRDKNLNDTFTFLRMQMDTTNARDMVGNIFHESYLSHMKQLYIDAVTDGMSTDPLKQNNIFNVLFWYNMVVNKNNITKSSYAKLLAETLFDQEAGDNPYRDFLEFKAYVGKDSETVNMGTRLSPVLTSNGIQFDIENLLLSYEMSEPEYQGTTWSDSGLEWDPSQDTEQDYDEQDWSMDTQGGAGDGEAEIEDEEQYDDVLDDYEEGGTKEPFMEVKVIKVRQRQFGKRGTVTRIERTVGSNTTTVVEESTNLAPSSLIPHASSLASKFSTFDRFNPLKARTFITESADAVNYMKMSNMTMFDFLNSISGNAEVKITYTNDDGDVVTEAYNSQKEYKCI